MNESDYLGPMILTPSLLEAIIKVAHDAGKVIVDFCKLDFEVSYKGDQSPVTEADLSAHRYIESQLKSLTPHIPMLSEEDASAFSGPNEAGYYWLVDPLDGTKEFLKKNDEFTVNIALIYQGISILGVVGAPAKDVIYFAVQNQGAFKQNASGRFPIKAASRKPNTNLRVVGSRSHGNDALNEWLKQVGNYELISMGSSLKLCLVAEGKADVYPRFGLTSLWDTAAAQCVVEEAGAKVLSLNGERLSYANPYKVLNPHFIVCVEAISTFQQKY